MAALVDKTMGALNQARKPMYPLFEKPQRSNQAKNETSADQPSPSNTAPVPSSLEHGTSRQQETEMGHTCLQPLGSQTESGPSKPDGERLEVDLNLDRRKRRRTSSPKSNESPGRDQVHASFERPNTPNTSDSQKGIDGPVNETTPLTMTTRLAAEEPRGQPLDTNNSLPSHVNVPMDEKQYKALGNDSNDLPKVSSASASTRETKSNTVLHGWANTPQGDLVVTEAVGDEAKPKKILRLNPKTGTIGSPPAKTRAAHPEVVQKTMRASRQKQPASKLVIVRYGQETGLPSETGQKIDQILGGSATATSLISSASLKRKPISRKVAGANPGATPHPFFLAKTTVNASAIQKPSSSTSEEKTIPRRQDSSITYLTAPKFPKRPLDKAPASAFSAFGGFGAKNPKILKFPGAVEPAWPWKGMTHIHDENEIQAAVKFPTNSLPTIPPKTRKSKHQAVEVLAGEDVIDILAAELCISSIVQSTREINADEYPALPECLRVPTRHVTTGLRVQNLVQKELSASFSPYNVNKEDSSSEDESQASSPKKKPVHPAIANLYSSLATSLSAFDQSRCETQSWTQKYSPKAAAEVLQTGREAMILKEWLQALTVQSVETGARDRSGSRASSVSRHSAVPGKRKQRSKKLEGFIVSSDEDEGDMDEISELEDDALLHGSQGTKRTVVRSNNANAKGSGRLTNAIVISGSHGCGKTAAVYAVANELGFEIFEINSSSRRSGKDILEKVGDMTHNHLVQSTQKEAPAEPIDEDAQRIADALESDIKSGRQGTVNSFFKPKVAAKAKDKSKKPESAVIEIDAIKTKVGPKAPPKQQKQSLILFEEADILYEEDKQFWATVMAMIIQSKRPIIITCTDESVIPLDCMSLHAIIRFPQPPIDLAIDYMLLVAANEGHLLRRDAVKSLYESRGLDLRSSMTELNFWCQFAVGDVKGGLEWLYTRWPPGSDIDELGHIIRVMSEGTYETGMGWLSQDFLKSGLQYLAVEDEISHEVWDGWHLDLGDYDKSLGIAGWATEMQSQAKGRIRDAAAVNIYGDYLDAMSAADMCASGAFAPDNKIRLDHSLPELTSKAREDYVLAYELLEATPLVSFDAVGADISMWMTSQARKYLQMDQHRRHNFDTPLELDRPSEAQIIDLIRHHSSSSESSLSRRDFSLAFDPISEPEKTSLYNTGSLEASSFDRNLSLIVLDIAPFVRSIVAYDSRLQQDRSRLSNLMSEGGRRGKRMRTTRSAMSALEGGARSTTRRDRYFGPGLNPYFVLRTGVQSWLDAMIAKTEDMGKDKIESGAKDITEEKIASDS